MPPRTVLFLQLPFLDNDTGDQRENVPLAAAYLKHALERSDEAAFHRTRIATPETDRLDDDRLCRYIASQRPDVLVATLYLWNVERTLAVLRRVRRLMPGVRVAVGGPEVARGHPFLFRAGIADVAVVGEGERVFPPILRGFRVGCRTDFSTVAWKVGTRYEWGSRAAPPVELVRDLPPARHPDNRPDGRGVAYLEASRGCAFSCAFCRYGHLRRRLTFLDATGVAERVATLRRRGAREIRFVDPTFNANPHFESILRALAERNRDRAVGFFAELRADTVLPVNAALLREANFREIEAGVQSLDPVVLRRIRRPTDTGRTDAGLRHLAKQGIRTTIDVMCGLPGQTPDDVRKALRWAGSFRHGRVQFLHTLLIPGTALRRNRRRLGLSAQSLPPYRVSATPHLPSTRIAGLESAAGRIACGVTDHPTQRFVGRSLPGLFLERIRVNSSALRGEIRIPGTSNRRTLVFEGGASLTNDLPRLARWIRAAIRSEPYGLWQFVLAPRQEEPLDLFDRLIGVIDEFPRHFLDRLVGLPGRPPRAARRIMVRLRPRGSYRRSWIRAAEELLAAHFY